jgi:hypothetical protein
MKYRYKNSFHKPNGVDGVGRPYTYGPEYYETNSEPIEHAGHQIFERQEFGFPCFDVVLNGVCVAQRAGLSGAERIAEARLKELEKPLYAT